MRDYQLKLSSSQALSGVADTGILQDENLLDFGTLKNTWDTTITPDTGNSARLILALFVEAAVVCAGGATNYIEVAYASHTVDTSFATAATKHLEFRLYHGVAVGARFYYRLPAGTMNKVQGLIYTPKVGNLTSATVTADLVDAIETPTTQYGVSL